MSITINQYYSMSRQQISCQCGNKFLTEHQLESHQRRCKNAIRTKSHKCECGKGFTLRQGLVQHKKFSCALYRYRCDVCRRRFSTEADLVTHKYNCCNKLFRCECGKTYLREANLKNHKFQSCNYNVLNDVVDAINDVVDAIVVDAIIVEENNVQPFEDRHPSSSYYTAPRYNASAITNECMRVGYTASAITNECMRVGYTASAITNECMRVGYTASAITNECMRVGYTASAITNECMRVGYTCQCGMSYMNEVMLIRHKTYYCKLLNRQIVDDSETEEE